MKRLGLQSGPVESRRWWAVYRKPQALAMVLVVLVVISAIGIKYYVDKHNKSKASSGESAQQNRKEFLVNQFKNAKTNDEKALLITAYINDHKYEDAEKVSKEIAVSTNLSSDWLRLLNICSSYPVKDKAECINNTKTYFSNTTNVAKLNFRVAYGAATIFDEIHENAVSAQLYAKALSVYDDAQVDEYTKSRADITQRIQELTK